MARAALRASWLSAPAAVRLVPETAGTLAVADLRGGRVRRRVHTGVSAIGDVAPAGRTVWLSASGPFVVMRLDARTGRPIGKPVRVGAAALNIEATADRAWVDLGDEDTLVGVPARGSAPGVRAANGGSVFAIAVGLGSVWASNYGADTVTRLDAETGARIGEPSPPAPIPRASPSGWAPCGWRTPATAR